LTDDDHEDGPLRARLHRDQTIDHQRTQAEAAGFKIDVVWPTKRVRRSCASDRATTGSTPVRLAAGRRHPRGAMGGSPWRNYADVSDTIREFMRRGVVIRTVINNMTFDGATKEPMRQAVRDALIAFMAATAQAQAEATKEAQRAGIDHAKALGDRRYKAGSRPIAGPIRRRRDLLARTRDQRHRQGNGLTRKRFIASRMNPWRRGGSGGVAL